MLLVDSDDLEAVTAHANFHILPISISAQCPVCTGLDPTLANAMQVSENA